MKNLADIAQPLKISLSQKESEPYVLALFADGEFIRDLHFSIFGRNPALKAANRQELTNLIDELEYKGARRFALKRLAAKNYYSKELEKSLKKRLVSSLIIKKVILECQILGFLDDQRWLEGMIRVFYAKKEGARTILIKLKAKGVPENEALSAIQEFCCPEVEQENIMKLLTTRYRRRNLLDPKEKKKVISALVRKGYNLSEIFSAIQGVLKPGSPYCK